MCWQDSPVLVAEQSLEVHWARVKPFASLCVKLILKLIPMSRIMSLMKYMQNRYASHTQLFTQIIVNIPLGKEQIRLGYKRVIGVSVK